MTVRARLKYFDGNNNEVVIGSLDDDGGEGIQDLTLKNRAREYTKVIVSGGNGLFGKFPTDSASSPDVTPQENADGPEIFLEVFNQSTGVFEVRDRVFAESQGTVSDNGNFKHKRLYGFEKFVGRQNVELTGSNSVTTDIEQVLNDALPNGYVADVPSGVTVPTVNDYRFKVLSHFSVSPFSPFLFAHVFQSYFSATSSNSSPTPGRLPSLFSHRSQHPASTSYNVSTPDHPR